ncbi:MAG: ornithine cyclodeaminase family protein [Alphaproteobacteria bacterium]|nr:ornithine cyclodeaminase family protein [Alphaproteobacteria bacterium]
MIIVPENKIADLITATDAFDAMEKLFVSMANGTAYNFPVIREAIGHADALYGFKSGFDREALQLGLKSGGYWPSNAAKGLTNHQSTVFLFDADTGKCKAVVGGNLLTALRTAAASAVATAHLARTDSEVLGIVGAGHQSAFQLRANLATRNFKKVIGWNLHPEQLSRPASIAEEAGLPFESVSLEELGQKADVIITITSSFKPILLDLHIKAGTHLSCMGTDTTGKQEIDAQIAKRAKLYTDEIAQSITLGEFQHPIKEKLIGNDDICPIGKAIQDKALARVSDDDITIFDGTGVGLQDLAVASQVVEKAIANNVATEIDF